MAHIGYIRVSSIGQNTERQLDSDALASVGIALDDVFEEKASAKSTEGRPKLAEAIRFLRKGDTLHVHSIDRLARNVEELAKIVRELTKKGVSVRFHKENLTFTGEDEAMSKLLLHVMGAFAEFERALIRERQREGIEKAKASGKHLGRSRSLSDDQVDAIRARKACGEPVVRLAKSYGVSRQTIYDALRTS
jgi:DNA invertase Pin-like site-specific DNA recombinase